MEASPQGLGLSKALALDTLLRGDLFARSRRRAASPSSSPSSSPWLAAGPHRREGTISCRLVYSPRLGLKCAACVCVCSRGPLSGVKGSAILMMLWVSMGPFLDVGFRRDTHTPRVGEGAEPQGLTRMCVCGPFFGDCCAFANPAPFEALRPQSGTPCCARFGARIAGALSGGARRTDRPCRPQGVCGDAGERGPDRKMALPWTPDATRSPFWMPWMRERVAAAAWRPLEPMLPP